MHLTITASPPPILYLYMTRELTDKLIKLDYSSQLAFAYLTCERWFPTYVQYSKNFNFGDPQVLRRAIDYIYANLFTHEFHLPTISSLVEELNNNAPEEVDTALISAVSTAIAVIANTFDFVYNKNIERLEEIPGMSTEALYYYIQEAGELDDMEDDFEQKIAGHPLMLREKGIQNGILAYLLITEKLDYEDISMLISLQESERRGSLDL